MNAGSEQRTALPVGQHNGKRWPQIPKKRLQSQGQGRAASVLRSSADKSIDRNGIYVPRTAFGKEKHPEVSLETVSLTMKDQANYRK